MGWFNTAAWPPERGFFYTLLVVSLVTSKLLHLFSHLTSLPIVLFLLYLPTFLLPDVLVILGSRVVFQYSRIAGGILCFTVTTAAASQIGFFLETGGEIRWSMMAKVLREPEGFFGMLMSGFPGLAACTAILAGISWGLNPWAYTCAGRALRSMWTTVFPRCTEQLERANASDYLALPNHDDDHVEDAYQMLDSGSDSDDSIAAEKLAAQSRFRRGWFGGIWWSRVKLAVPVITVLVLQIVRPKSPYQHMSGTLPFTIFEGIFTKRSPLCDPRPHDGPHGFPLMENIGKEKWIPSEGQGGIGRGWMPGMPWWDVERKRPSWLPDVPVDGFAKYYRATHRPPPPPMDEEGHKRGRHPHHPGGPRHHPKGLKQRPMPPMPPGYDSVLDPLKVSNADQPILEQIKKALDGKKVPIKHVVLLSLESTRKDVFPLIKDGILESQLSKSRSSHEKRSSSETFADLSELSKTAEMATGQDGGWGHNLTSSFGGINVQGALTGSTFTLKSLLGSHCGVSPLPVDFLEELETEIYQPCLPQILKVMNMQKSDSPEKSQPDWVSAPWKSVFMQAATNKFDRQAPFLEQLGFDETIVREDLLKPDAKYPPKGPELNYFGFSEKELKPYMQDLFKNAKEKGERVFLSHLTSSTHHPWATPEEFGKQERYWGGSRGGGTPWDHYLNSIKWGDRWVGEVLDMLKELGVEEETLVVMVGDHGFSFSDDSTAKTTYSNPHINSFRVPLVFRHPLLPNIQLRDTTVTSTSIIPTILDLLAATNSLSPTRAKIGHDLVPEYEGQSLARPFVPEKDGREYLNFGVVNPGGTHLSLVSSANKFRLVIPICEPTTYTFSSLSADPAEQEQVEDWEGGPKLRLKVKARYGDDATRWVGDMQKVAEWVVWEGRRRWGYWEGTRGDDRGVEHRGDGRLGKDHWWDT